MNLRGIIVALILAFSIPSYGWEPSHPTTTTVDDLVATNIYGNLKVRDMYIDGELTSREWKFVSYRGNVVIINLTRGGDHIDIRTPGERILIKRLSPWKYEIVDMKTGSKKIVTGTPESPDAIGPGDSNSAWFQDFWAFKEY